MVCAVDTNKWLMKKDQDMDVIGVCLCLMRIINDAVGVPSDEFKTMVCDKSYCIIYFRLCAMIYQRSYSNFTLIKCTEYTWNSEW